jgi:hypothetical protein
VVDHVLQNLADGGSHFWLASLRTSKSFFSTLSPPPSFYRTRLSSSDRRRRPTAADQGWRRPAAPDQGGGTISRAEAAGGTRSGQRPAAGGTGSRRRQNQIESEQRGRGGLRLDGDGFSSALQHQRDLFLSFDGRVRPGAAIPVIRL